MHITQYQVRLNTWRKYETIFGYDTLTDRTMQQSYEWPQVTFSPTSLEVTCSICRKLL